jgi:hypothetical protein
MTARQEMLKTYLNQDAGHANPFVGVTQVVFDGVRPAVAHALPAPELAIEVGRVERELTSKGQVRRRDSTRTF